MYNKFEIEAKALEEFPETTGYPLDPCTDRERAAFIKGCQYAATPSVVSGLQWVKASERLPDPELTVVARDIDTLNNVDQWDIYKMDQDHLEAIEWLDESSPAQPGYSDWISAAESPKASGEYLVVYQGPHKTAVTIANYYTSDGWDRYKHNDYQVTHWQKIPSPPLNLQP